MADGGAYARRPAARPSPSIPSEVPMRRRATIFPLVALATLLASAAPLARADGVDPLANRTVRAKALHPGSQFVATAEWASGVAFDGKPGEQMSVYGMVQGDRPRRPTWLGVLGKGPLPDPRRPENAVDVLGHSLDVRVAGKCQHQIAQWIDQVDAIRARGKRGMEDTVDRPLRGIRFLVEKPGLYGWVFSDAGCHHIA